MFWYNLRVRLDYSYLFIYICLFIHICFHVYVSREPLGVDFRFYSRFTNKKEMVLPSTRDLVARTRSSSPLESLHREESQREEQREDGGRKNPLNVNRMRAICTRIREFLMLMPGESPALGITAEWKRKDSPNSEIRKTTAKVSKEGLDLWALWENEASKEYPFPHPDMNYYDIEIDSEINQEQVEEEAQAENEIGEHMDPNNLDPYEPITFEGLKHFGAQAILTEVVQKALRGNEPVFLGFIDFQSAFPSVSHDTIADALEAFSVPPMLRRMILATYESPTGHVKTDFGYTKSFEISSGVLQGDVLAPFLFIMCLDRILALAMKNPNYGLTLFSTGTKSRGVSKLRITDVDYADDVVFFAATRETLRDMMIALVEVAKNAGLKVNVGPTKTAWMVIGRKTSQMRYEDISLPEQGVVPKVDSYRYLGHLKHETKKQLTFKIDCR